MNERQDAFGRAFRLIYEVQASVPDAATDLAALADLARSRDWGEVARACLFGEAVRAWITRDPSVGDAVAALIADADAEAAGDAVMLALGLALRSDPGFSGDELAAAALRDEDLARALVLLETGDGDPLERISAHTACAIALGNRWLFELAEEQYDAALAIGAGEAPGSLDFLLAPIVFNLAEGQVTWAGMLRQLGDDAGVAERHRAWADAARAAERYEMPEPWRVELDALALVLASTAGEDCGDAAMRLLDVLPADQGRTAGLLRLALALSATNAKRPDAAALIDAAIAALDENVHPHAHELALFLAAEREAGAGAAAGLRYARRVFETQWARRIAALGAMQARRGAERLTAERELLNRAAHLDDLTGIGNRRALDSYIAELERGGSGSVALVLLDVDAFKDVNDLYGHLAGDGVLIGIARLLERHLGPNDLAVRLGGDEFALALADGDLDAAYARAETLLAAFEESRDPDIDVAVHLSAGVSSGPTVDMAGLRASANAALYRAKACGGHCVVKAAALDAS